jgi:hypothetical protein
MPGTALRILHDRVLNHACDANNLAGGFFSAMITPETSRNVNAREAIQFIRGPMSNLELMEKFKISPKGFADLLKQLFEKKLITEEDLKRRGIRFKVLKKEESAAPQVETTPPPAPSPLMSVEHPEEFLDTVELTALLSSFDDPPKPPKQKEEPPPVVEEPATKEEIAEKKAKFSISGLFRKKS